MDYQLFVTPGLGDNSYLLVSGNEAALIDPQRDAWRFLSVAGSRQLAVRYVLETHVHNDYVTGALEVRAATGAEVAAPARGKYEFPHRRMAEGDELRVGAVRLVAIETPGHTFEHVSWLAYDDGASDPVAVFTGGSLIVGSAGRTDLLGHDVADELTRAQFESVRRLAKLPAHVQVLPTHGAGSFCTASVASMARTSTIGEEIAGNPALRPRDLETFVHQQLSGLRAYPSYYPHIAPINRRGPGVLRSLPRPPALTAEDVERRLESDVWVVDARDRRAFAEALLSAPASGRSAVRCRRHWRVAAFFPSGCSPIFIDGIGLQHEDAKMPVHGRRRGRHSACTAWGVFDCRNRERGGAAAVRRGRRGPSRSRSHRPAGGLPSHARRRPCVSHGSCSR